MIKAAKIELEGMIQGVGFRPFVHRLARQMSVTGFVLNTSTGVKIHAEAQPAVLKEFYRKLRAEIPPLARLTGARFSSAPAAGWSAFSIRESEKTPLRSTLISPDIAICPDCLRELFDKKDRRYLYPFINCTNCGPRFSIIRGLPYDRGLTTMEKFRMCPDCKKEFRDINDRRYHAQPNACPVCGPRVRLIKNSRVKNSGVKAIAETIRALKNGSAAAIKGIGGFHIACDAYNLKAVEKLRLLKDRPAKPFALMVADIAEAKKLCRVSGIEEKLLSSPERPIVLLEKRSESSLSRILAPDNNYLGIMLCYAPLHYLLFSRELSSGEPLRCLIMTSANIADEPVEIENDQAVKNLNAVCSHFLVHDRAIYNRSDDSIVQLMDGRPIVLRRSRGYSPFPFLTDLKFKAVLACGAELKNTFCLAEGKFAFLSQYIGDLKSYANYNFFRETIKRLSGLFKIKPGMICHDLHPDYLSTKYSRELADKDRSLKTAAIQHHEAHLASVICEHRIKEKVIGVCFDGIGYGRDGKTWGGEFFTGGLRKFERAGHLEEIALPGGDKATAEPYRMAISYLYTACGRGIYNLKLDFLKRHEDKLESIVNLTGFSPRTSSAGRLFDAVSALLGICDIITYEAQAAVRLQQRAERSSTAEFYRFNYDHNGGILVVKSGELILKIVQDIENKIPAEVIARKFHNSVALMSRNVCAVLRRKTGLNTVALSGGVFQNKLLLEMTVKLLRRDKFTVYYNQLLPGNDGAISLGQAAIANAGTVLKPA